jgi:hypothetical protein
MLVLRSEKQGEYMELTEWMEQHGETNASLAEKMRISYELVYKITTGVRMPTNNFKWRFGVVFGFDQAETLFGTTIEREAERV